MNIKVKLLRDQVTLPKKASEGSVGWDLKAIEAVEIPSHSTRKVPCGFAMELPSGYEAQIRSRSGLAWKGLVVANSPGTIDSDYRGEVCVLLRNDSSQNFIVKEGDRIAQMIIAKVPHVMLVESEELSDSARGDGGFGSTGR